MWYTFLVENNVKEADSLSEDGQQVFLKLENTQPINSFKIRGAYYMVSKLTPKELEKGLCTCSAGNHAQGVGLEIMNQLPDADAVVIPVGGGGLASGIAIAVKAINPDCRIYLVEPENAASMKASVEAGKPIELKNADTIADGTAVKKPGDLTYKICNSLCDGFITVSEDDIKSAIAHLYLNEGITAEGAGALSTAAVLTGQIPSSCKKVVCVVSGSNIDPAVLQKILDEAAK